jgi:hypothetical protein
VCKVASCRKGTWIVTRVCVCVCMLHAFRGFGTVFEAQSELMSVSCVFMRAHRSEIALAQEIP